MFKQPHVVLFFVPQMVLDATFLRTLIFSKADNLCTGASMTEDSFLDVRSKAAIPISNSAGAAHLRQSLQDVESLGKEGIDICTEMAPLVTVVAPNGGDDTSGVDDEAALVTQRTADFATLDDGLKLKMVSSYLRAAHLYCVWCGMQVFCRCFSINQHVQIFLP